MPSAIPFEVYGYIEVHYLNQLVTAAYNSQTFIPSRVVAVK